MQDNVPGYLCRNISLLWGIFWRKPNAHPGRKSTDICASNSKVQELVGAGLLCGWLRRMRGSPRDAPFGPWLGRLLGAAWIPGALEGTVGSGPRRRRGPEPPARARRFIAGLAKGTAKLTLERQFQTGGNLGESNAGLHPGNGMGAGVAEPAAAAPPQHHPHSIIPAASPSQHHPRSSTR